MKIILSLDLYGPDREFQKGTPPPPPGHALIEITGELKTPNQYISKYVIPEALRVTGCGDRELFRVTEEKKVELTWHGQIVERFV